MTFKSNISLGRPGIAFKSDRLLSEFEESINEGYIQKTINGLGPFFSNTSIIL